MSCVFCIIFKHALTRSIYKQNCLKKNCFFQFFFEQFYLYYLFVVQMQFEIEEVTCVVAQVFMSVAPLTQFCKRVFRMPDLPNASSVTYERTQYRRIDILVRVYVCLSYALSKNRSSNAWLSVNVLLNTTNRISTVKILKHQ